LGLIGERNPTGDAQKKLDVFSNETIIEAFANTGLVAAVVSEDLEEAQCLACATFTRYILCIDPLDCSSITDINGSVGTIFGIYHMKSESSQQIVEDFLRKGVEQVAAGYLMYGASTVLVYTVGHGVHGFTQDRNVGEFHLSHRNIRWPVRERTYCANLAHHQWHPNIQKLVGYLTELDPDTNRPYSLRNIGALVADLHRCLIQGELHFYQADAMH
jgi:fructose-1,6-bisphosphatase I